MGQIIVGMADCRIGTNPDDVLATFALGSCIGLTLYDPKACVGGLLHYMLPDSAINPERGKLNPYTFADLGIPILLQKVYAMGAVRRNLVAHAAGGASIMDPENVFDIGRRNHISMRRILWKAGVLLSGEAVGGNQSRTVRLEIGSGRLWLQESGGPRQLVEGFPRGSAPSMDRASDMSAAGLAQKGGANGIPRFDRR